MKFCCRGICWPQRWAELVNQSSSRGRLRENVGIVWIRSSTYHMNMRFHSILMDFEVYTLQVSAICDLNNEIRPKIKFWGHFHPFKRFCCQTALTHARDERFRSSLETTCLIVFSSQCESKHTPQVSVETHLVRSQLQSDIWGRQVIFSEKMTNFLKRHKHCNNNSNSKFQETNKTSRFF